MSVNETPHERKRVEGRCFKFHKKGHRVLQCPEVKGKKPVGTPNKQK
jgi:hypothetical protein